MNCDITGRLNADRVVFGLKEDTHYMSVGFFYSNGVPKLTLEVKPYEDCGVHYTLGEDGDWWAKVAEGAPITISFGAED